jgi:hypothetical protein
MGEDFVLVRPDLGLRCGAFAFFKLHHRVGGGVRGTRRHGLVPAREGLCILPS